MMLGLSGCGAEFYSAEIDEAFLPYLVEISETGTINTQVDIRFSTVDLDSHFKKTGALAYYNPNIHEIVVDYDKWLNLSDEFRVATLAHELVHAAGVGHIHGQDNLMSIYIQQTVKAVRNLGLKQAILEVL